MKQLIVSMFSICALTLSGCASTIDMKAYDSSSPKRIGVIIGHDIKIFYEPETGYGGIIGGSIGGAIGGAIGGVIDASTTTENVCRGTLTFENDIKDILWENIQNKMQEKNYVVQLYKTKPKEWSLFENRTDGKDVYPNLVTYYQLEEKTKDCDAILFVELLIEYRQICDDKIEDVKASNIKMGYAKSKLFLYDTASGKRIFHDLIQRGYSTWSKVKLPEAIDTLVALEPLPVANIQ